MEISQQEFIYACNLYPPNKLVKFAYRYFSRSTIKKDEWLSKIVESLLFFFFLSGFIATVLQLSKKFIVIVSSLFFLLLISVGFIMTYAFISNNLRIKKICKYLKINTLEYNSLAEKYLR